MVKSKTLRNTLFMLLILSSCSAPNYYRETPDYKNPAYLTAKLLQRNMVIDEVIDNRFPGKVKSSEDYIEPPELIKKPEKKSKKPEYVKTKKEFDESRYLGCFDELYDKTYYYYRFTEPLEVFVKKSLDKILCDSLYQTDENKFHIKVYIDTFLLEDFGGFFSATISIHCAMSFVFSDSSGNRTIPVSFSDSFTSAGNIMPRVQFMVYDCIYQCAAEFAGKFKNRDKIFIPDNQSLTANTDSMPSSVNSFDTKFYKSVIKSEYTPFFQMGNNISFRAGISVCLYENKKNTAFLNGVGTSFSMFSAGEGSYWGGNISYNPKIFLSKSQEGFFLKPSVELLFGMEGFNSKSLFFIGPMVTEFIGYDFGSFCLIAGAYQMKIWGSENLSVDDGFSIGLSFFGN